MKDQIDALQDAYAHLLNAHTAYAKFLNLRRKSDAEGVLRSITDAAKSVTRTCAEITAERDRQNERIYGRGIIRVRIFGGGHSREVTVQRPDNLCATPYVTEAAYNALRFAFGTPSMRTDCGFGISVLSPRGNVVCLIRNGNVV